MPRCTEIRMLLFLQDSLSTDGWPSKVGQNSVFIAARTYFSLEIINTKKDSLLQILSIFFFFCVPPASCSDVAAEVSSRR